MKKHLHLKRAMKPIGLLLMLMIAIGWTAPATTNRHAAVQLTDITPAPRSPTSVAIADRRLAVTNTPTPSAKVVVIVGAANIRTGPGLSYPRTSIVRRSERLTVIGQASACKWLRVITPKGLTGWISTSLTNLSIPCRLIPSSSLATPGATTVAPPQTAQIALALFAAPALIEPHDGDRVSGPTTFVWEWNGQPLAENQAFEVRVWSAEQPYHYGATGLVRSTSVTFDIAGAYGVQQGGTGRSYFWTVALVEQDPYKWIGMEAPPRAIIVAMEETTATLIAPFTPELTPTLVASPGPTDAYPRPYAH